MGGLHLVLNPEHFAIAIERGLPYYRTACGTPAIVDIADLTDVPGHVSCPRCRHLIEASMAQMQAQSSVVDFDDESVEVDFGDDDDSDEPDDGDADLDGWSLGEVSVKVDGEIAEAEVSEGISGISAEMVQTVVQSMLGDVQISESWEKWTLDLSESFGEEVDLRELVDPTDLALLQGLHGLSGMIGLEDLTAGVLSVIDRLARRVVEAEQGRE